MPRAPRNVRNDGTLVVAPEAARLAGALVRHAHKIPDLESVVLFGSSTDGTFDGRSDIDLLFLFDAPHPEQTHADAVLSTLRSVRSESGTRREINPILAPLRNAGLDQDFLDQVARKGIVIWGRPDGRLPPARDGGRMVLLRWDSSPLTPAQRTKVHRVLFGERGRKTVRGRRYEWSTPGLIPKDYHVGPGTLLLPQADAGAVERALRDAGAKPERQRFLAA